jgi:hypothetical protein
MAKKIAFGGTAAIGAWQCHDVPNTKTERQLNIAVVADPSQMRNKKTKISPTYALAVTRHNSHSSSAPLGTGFFIF